MSLTDAVACLVVLMTNILLWLGFAAELTVQPLL